MPEDRVRRSSGQEPGNLKEYGQATPVPKNVLESVENLKKQTVLVAESLECCAVKAAKLTTPEKIIGKADVNSFFAAVPECLMEINGSAEVWRV
jgi:hypothetical protein